MGLCQSQGEIHSYLALPVVSLQCIALHLTKITFSYTHVPSLTSTHRKYAAAQCLSFCVMYAAVPPTIAQVTADSVDLNPMLMEGETLSLTCSTKGTPRPRIVWYRGDSRIGISSRTQINKTEVGDTILKSILVISSVVVSDSGTYECRVENIASTTSLQYQVVVSEFINSLVYCV